MVTSTVRITLFHMQRLENEPELQFYLYRVFVVGHRITRRQSIHKPLQPKVKLNFPSSRFRLAFMTYWLQAHSQGVAWVERSPSKIRWSGINPQVLKRRNVRHQRAVRPDADKSPTASRLAQTTIKTKLVYARKNSCHRGIRTWQCIRLELFDSHRV